MSNPTSVWCVPCSGKRWALGTECLTCGRDYRVKAPPKPKAEQSTDNQVADDLFGDVTGSPV
jgi:hypothetical protein